MRTFALRCWLVLCLFVSLPCFAADTSDPPPGAVLRVAAISGAAVVAPNQNTLMRYGGERRLDDPAIQLHVDQWLHPGQVVMARENAVVTLHWIDGRETRIGPRTVPVFEAIRPLPRVASPPAPDTSMSASAWRTLERLRHPAPVLLFASGVLFALLPLLRRRPYRPGIVARLLAAMLFALLTLPVSLLIVAASTLGRMAWYQPPLTGAVWTGGAAAAALAANVFALLAVLGGLAALWVLSIAFVSGGAERLGRRGRFWWLLAAAGIVCMSVAYMAPHAPNLDLESAWYRFWNGWSRYYAIGAWLLLPFAHLLACVPSARTARLRWQGIAASGVAIAFAACYTVGYAEDDEPYLAASARGDVASHVAARKAICRADDVFEGVPANFRVVAAAGCAARTDGESGPLHDCEAAAVDVRVDKVLRSPHLAPGDAVEFRVEHARLDVAELRQVFDGHRLRFLARSEDDGGHAVYVSANRLERGYVATGDDDYARRLLAQCPR